MPVCPVCHAEESREERVDEVFRIDGEYVLVGGIPAMVCARCGEQAFSRETVGKGKGMLKWSSALCAYAAYCGMITTRTGATITQFIQTTRPQPAATPVLPVPRAPFPPA